MLLGEQNILVWGYLYMTELMWSWRNLHYSNGRIREQKYWQEMVMFIKLYYSTIFERSMVQCSKDDWLYDDGDSCECNLKFFLKIIQILQIIVSVLHSESNSNKFLVVWTTWRIKDRLKGDSYICQPVCITIKSKGATISGGECTPCRFK